MKKYLMMIVTLALVLSGSFCAYADCWWDTDNYGIKANWDQLNSKGTLYLYKGTSYKVGNKITTAQDRTVYDFTQRISDMGPGTYHFTITDTSGRTWESPNLQVSENMYESISLPIWSKENGKWRLRDFNGNLLTGWQQVDGKWYYLDTQSGDCYLDTVTPDGYRVDASGAWDGKPAGSS